jgi:hypothetical protein
MPGQGEALFFSTPGKAKKPNNIAVCHATFRQSKKPSPTQITQGKISPSS